MDIVQGEYDSPTFPINQTYDNKIDIDNFIASKTRISRAMNEEMTAQLYF